MVRVFPHCYFVCVVCGSTYGWWPAASMLNEAVFIRWLLIIRYLLFQCHIIYVKSAAIVLPLNERMEPF